MKSPFLILVVLIPSQFAFAGLVYECQRNFAPSSTAKVISATVQITETVDTFRWPGGSVDVHADKGVIYDDIKWVRFRGDSGEHSGSFTKGALIYLEPEKGDYPFLEFKDCKKITGATSGASVSGRGVLKTYPTPERSPTDAEGNSVKAGP